MAEGVGELGNEPAGTLGEKRISTGVEIQGVKHGQKTNHQIPAPTER